MGLHRHPILWGGTEPGFTRASPTFRLENCGRRLGPAAAAPAGRPTQEGQSRSQEDDQTIVTVPVLSRFAVPVCPLLIG